MGRPVGRKGTETKAAAQRVALSLFIAKGYEATSLREIAEELGISKAALYYHFASKEDIVREGLAARGKEAAELLAWARTQIPDQGLLEAAVLRWVGSTSVEKLRGIRFMNANPTLLRNLSQGSGDIGNSLQLLATLVAGPNAGPQRLLLVRMAFLSMNSAVAATQGIHLRDEDVVAVALDSAHALLTVLREVT